MTRIVTLTCSAELADALIARAREREGILGIQRQRDASVQPPADVVTLQLTNEALQGVQRDVRELGVLESGGSVATSEPKSYSSSAHRVSADAETNEAAWEEAGALVRRESNVNHNYLLLMAAAGAVAAVGLWTDTLHLVIGAMVIAPGFAPLTRISLGLVTTERPLARAGVLSALAGYGALAVAAALALLLLRVIDPSRPADLSERALVSYWSTPTWTGVLVAVAASAAGAAVTMSLRSVLAAGVMIALALVPGASIMGMALAAGDPALAGLGFLRWGIDAAIVAGVGLAVLAVKRAATQRRSALERSPRREGPGLRRKSA